MCDDHTPLPGSLMAPVDPPAEGGCEERRDPPPDRTADPAAGYRLLAGLLLALFLALCVLSCEQ